MPERAPDSQRERIARPLYEAGIGESLWSWEHMCNTSTAARFRNMVDAVLAARDKENAERDQDMFVTLRADLTTARERVAELESAWDVLLRRAQIAEEGWHSERQRLEQAEARIGQLEALISPHDLPPAAERSAPDEEPDPALLATLKQQVFGTDPDPRPRGR